MGRQQVGLQGQRLLKLRRRRVELPLGRQHDTEVAKRFGQIGPYGDQLPIGRFGRVQPARSMSLWAKAASCVGSIGVGRELLIAVVASWREPSG